MRAPDGPDVMAGEVLLSVANVSLSFGGVKAISGVSFDIRKGEIRAIIGPNGAGKTSMLNVINGFYQPQEGVITFKGKARAKMRPHDAADGGIARTFQNVALFRGMTALDNIMAGRTPRPPADWEEPMPPTVSGPKPELPSAGAPITTPAACLPNDRTRPSSLIAVSRSFFA